ncbi:MAG: TauD/TfdA family dioxygenase [Actinomycetota bacterium]|nr:TauD/TfdA family dioxygenase [Actinomycetota bacterium]
MAVSPTVAPTTNAHTVTLHDRYLTVPVEEAVVRCHYVWLRDNCWCAECRVSQTQERKLLTASIRPDIAPESVALDDDGTLRVAWNDDHVSTYTAAWLRAHDYSDQARAGRLAEPVLWDATFSVPAFEHDEVLGSPKVQIAYLEAVRDYGVALIHNTPSVPGEVERFAEKIGHVRETAFERIHNVRHDPAGYSVAHTPAELIPHTDLPGYHWPPSIQLLHFLVNEATGGQSTVTDGWSVLADLRAEDPAGFETLCRVPVPFQVFSNEEDTFATAAIVETDTDGRVRAFRFSNHLVQPLDTHFYDVETFYAAYRKLGQMIMSDRYKVAFKASSGDLLTVHGHRVMHGRLSFDPTSGARHLQDVYMEYDDLMARRRVLLGTHKPIPAAPGVA